MAYDPGAIDATLAATVGDEPALIVELRLAFITGAERTLGLMELAGGNVDEWRGAALRLHGLAASFGAVRLMTLARSAIDGRPGDLSTVAKLRRAIARL
ncbi:hypothetical protein GCM10022268_31680 [Sphingomonas cynarae]|uniref:HPt domain-containing protein n=1 Tax=Sphingomonas cynarae TaxID=930197 RepID=A0ABP7ENB4_9SPHN